MVEIYIENNRIDLFDDESIELTSTINNTDDITKIRTDFTQTFSVPASDNNNAIFRHYYNADIDNTFDARTKKKSNINIDGFPFRSGKMRLEKVIVKKGKPSSYSIIFWGELTSFKDIIGDDELSVLDTSDQDFAYTASTVVSKLETKSTISAIPISDKRQFFYDSTGNPTDNDTTINIAYASGTNGIKWNEINFSASIYYIFQKIQEKYNFVFSSDLIERDEFKNIYLLLKNNDDDRAKIREQVVIDGGLSPNITNNTLSFYTGLGQDGMVRMNISTIITPLAGFEDVNYSIIYVDNGVEVSRLDANGINTAELVLESVERIDRNVQIFIETSEIFEFEIEFIDAYYRLINPFGWVFWDSWSVNNSMTVGINYIISQNFPKMKVLDFLSGIFKMFKAVLLPEEGGNVYLNTTKDFYLEGKVYEITRYIDFESYDVNRGVIHNDIKFKYQEPSTILNQQFTKNTGASYGDEEFLLKDSDGILLDGTSLSVELPFEQVLFEQLIDLGTNNKINFQYGLLVDDKLDKVTPKPVLFYLNNVDLGGSEIAFDMPSAVIKLDGNINIPHSADDLNNPRFSINWGVEYSTFSFDNLTNQAITSTLFSNYWDDYIKNIYNVKKREYSYKGNLPASILTKLKLNDLLLIQNRYYRINNFKTDITTGKTTFNLFNTFETNFGLFAPSSYIVNIQPDDTQANVYVSNGAVINVNFLDIGYGTSWISYSSLNSILTLEASLAGYKEVLAVVDNGAGKTFDLLIKRH